LILSRAYASHLQVRAGLHCPAQLTPQPLLSNVSKPTPRSNGDLSDANFIFYLFSSRKVFETMVCGICQSWKARVSVRKRVSSHKTATAATPASTSATISPLKISHEKGKDYLTALPAELLLRIFPHLPLRSFFDLSHTSSFLRYFLKTHSSVICNDAITAYYPNQAKTLETEKRSGWLVPTHEELRRREDFFSDCLGVNLRDRRLCEHNPISKVKCAPLESLTDFRDFQILISDPGPQYLFFLQKGFLQAGVLYWYREEPVFIFRKEFNDFMKEFHRRVTCGECVRHGRSATARLGFPRELIWYYGSGQDWGTSNRAA